MTVEPMIIEKYFSPGFRTKPAVIVGSQTVKFFHNNPQEQRWEGFHLVGTGRDDVVVVRNFDPEYLSYWNSLIEGVRVINLFGTNPGKYLTEVILEDPEKIDEINRKRAINAKLMVFLPTPLEQKLANKLDIPLHGSPKISALYGTKSGIRKLSMEHNLSMPPGFICTTYAQVQKAIDYLKQKFDEIVIKHDTSLSGYFTKKIRTKDIPDLKLTLDKISAGEFTEGKDVVVVEGWLKSKASLCAHIEIIEEQEPIICAGWQQIMDTDGISYMGAGPLMLSKKATQSFLTGVRMLAIALKRKGAKGSYGPDFLIINGDETNLEEDTCVLIELNARAPYTAFPLELIKQMKGKIGTGFYTQHIKLKKSAPIKDILDVLREKKLLITKKSANATGVVPYNVGLLPWNIFDVVAIADSWEKASSIIQKVTAIFRA